ncbi:hypothetical protein FVER53590_25109 [Fusarium verticillioides]|nr:hypothetical protein FVER53590_25109 [Fusarium verticillioides]
MISWGRPCYINPHHYIFYLQTFRSLDFITAFKSEFRRVATGMSLVCPECWAVFIRSEHLQRHMEGHMGLRPFSCSECTASFSRKDILVRHMQIHDSSETPPSKQHRTPDAMVSFPVVDSERLRTSQPEISFVQAVLLSHLGMMFAPETTLTEAVPTTRALLETLCRKMACQTNFDAFGRLLGTEKSGQENWVEWIKKESLQRLFYSVWILDCQYSCFWSGPGIVTIDCLQLPAPFHQTLWEASCEEAWKKHRNMPIFKPVPFQTVLFEFYRTQKIDNLDPFNTLLLSIGIKYHAEKLDRVAIYLDILQDHAKTLPPSRLSGAVEITYLDPKQKRGADSP